MTCSHRNLTNVVSTYKIVSSHRIKTNITSTDKKKIFSQKMQTNIIHVSIEKKYFKELKQT